MNMRSARILASVAAFVLVPGCRTAPSSTSGERDGASQGADGGGAIVCSGPDATVCIAGAACTKGAQCVSLVCSHGAVKADDVSKGGPIDCPSGQTCTCQAPTPTDGVRNDSETDIDCGGGFVATGDRNPASDGAPRCRYQLHQRCILGTDCNQGVCNDNHGAGGRPFDCPSGATCTCQPPWDNDGVKNDSETGIDCGGGTTLASDGAPPCASGSPCLLTADCVSHLCVGAQAASGGRPEAPGRCTAASCTDGVKNGTETDVDCGGDICPPCAAGKACLVGSDCASDGCDYTNHCALAPSCVQHFGGDTCGSGEDIGPAPSATVAHESCCTSIAVPGYAEPGYPSKTVYLDKYEITAGRMRAFIDYVSSHNGGVPDVAGYMAAHRPALNWNQGWEIVLPSNDGSTSGPVDVEQFTVGDPASLYPTEYAPGSPCSTSWSIVPGTYSIYPGLENSLGPEPYFPECEASPTGGNYCEFHNFNCTNEVGSEGFGTFWFDLATSQDADPMSMGKYWSQDELDEKALNCTPFAMFAAFCAWDGGQIMSEGVFEAVTAGVTVNADPIPLPLCFPNCTTWPDCNGGTITSYDSATQCPNVYYYPYDSSSQTWDNSAVIAPPGRVPGDVVTMAGGAGPWHDLIGNLVEAVLFPSGVWSVEGAGLGFGDSEGCHYYQFTTPRMKNAETGARCMRFR